MSEKMTGGQAIASEHWTRQGPIRFSGRVYSSTILSTRSTKLETKSGPFTRATSKGYMALGHAQASGRVGACIVGPGPGLLNTGAASLQPPDSNAGALHCGQIPSSQIGGGMAHP